MALFDKVYGYVNICGIEFDFGGYTVPSTIPGFQPFNNSIPVNIDFVKAHFGLSSASLLEESSKGSSGTFYKQKVILQFPSTDDLRSERLEMFKKLRHVKMKLSNGLYIFLGRNDYFQNALPDVKYSSNEKITRIEIQTESIYSMGYITNPAMFGLPAAIPVSLLNLN